MTTYSTEEKYNELFYIYFNILNYAGHQLNLKTLAIQLVELFYVSDDTDLKINSLAFIEALKQFCQNENTSNQKVNGLKKVFVCITKNSKPKQLAILRQYLTECDYLNLTLFDLDSTQMQLNHKEQVIPREHDKTRTIIKIERESIKPIVQDRCSCGSVNKLLLNQADRIACKVANCEICKILLSLIDNARKRLNKSLVCINCAIEVLIKSLQNQGICSCCYRGGNGVNLIPNKICNLHSICDKCLKTSHLGNNECKFCFFNKFNLFLANATERNLFEKHDNIQCSYDFCDLKSQTAENPRKNENTPTVELTCGHFSCASSCSFCTFKKIFEINKSISDVPGAIQAVQVNQNDDSSNRIRTNRSDDRLDRKIERGLLYFLLFNDCIIFNNHFSIIKDRSLKVEKWIHI